MYYAQGNELPLRPPESSVGTSSVAPASALASNPLLRPQGLLGSPSSPAVTTPSAAFPTPAGAPAAAARAAPAIGSGGPSGAAAFTVPSSWALGGPAPAAPGSPLGQAGALHNGGPGPSRWAQAQAAQAQPWSSHAEPEPPVPRLVLQAAPSPQVIPDLAESRGTFRPESDIDRLVREQLEGQHTERTHIRNGVFKMSEYHTTWAGQLEDIVRSSGWAIIEGLQAASGTLLGRSYQRARRCLQPGGQGCAPGHLHPR